VGPLHEPHRTPHQEHAFGKMGKEKNKYEERSLFQKDLVIKEKLLPARGEGRHPGGAKKEKKHRPHPGNVAHPVHRVETTLLAETNHSGLSVGRGPHRDQQPQKSPTSFQKRI